MDEPLNIIEVRKNLIEYANLLANYVESDTSSNANENNLTHGETNISPKDDNEKLTLKELEEVYEYYCSLDTDQIIGSTCQRKKNTPRYCRILRILSIDETNGDVCKVLVKNFCEIDEDVNQEETEENYAELTPLIGVNPNSLISGLKLQCLYEEDGEWYDCVVESKKGRLVKITYVDYDASEEVRSDRLRLPQKTFATDALNQQEEEPPTVTTSNGYVIPRELLIRPNDSQKVRQEKRQKVAKIKYQQKTDKRDSLALSRKKTWQDHKKSVRKKLPI